MTTNETKNQQTVEENKGSYKITLYFVEKESEDGRYWYERPSGFYYSNIEDYIKGLTEQDANILVQELNQVNGGAKRTTRLITHFFNFREIGVTRRENYSVVYDEKTPLNKNYLKSPTFQELGNLEEKFKERKKKIEILEHRIKISKLENKLNDIKNFETEINKIRNESLVQVGQKIYVPTSCYISHAADDFNGGIATISSINNEGVEIVENPGCRYGLENLLENQILWKMEYGNSKAQACPDYSPEFNDNW